MEKHYDKKFKINIDMEKQAVSISIKVTDGLVNVYKSSISEFNLMIAEYESLLHNALRDLENNEEII
jgi:hypothetical protein